MTEAEVRECLREVERLLDRAREFEARLDEGSAHFEPSHLQITTIDCGNPASNVIPAQATATVNIRFNDTHSGDTLSAWLRHEAEAMAEATGCEIGLRISVSGEAFLTPPGELSALVARAVEAETGRKPVASTSGGTSDARFVKDHCPVVEFGLVGRTMHMVDERVAIGDLETLTRIYGDFLRRWFA